MTREEALYKVNGYLTDIIPTEDYSEVEEIIKPLEQEPCEDCISRRAVLDIDIKKLMLTTAKPIEMIEQKIKQLPPITPQPKMGKWIKSSIGGAKICNICQAHMGLSNFKYCPNCGAKMKSEE